MIRKSGGRFFEKIVLNQKTGISARLPKAQLRFAASRPMLAAGL
jgi:hypothetical protein